jgi:hypothetical protein
MRAITLFISGALVGYLVGRRSVLQVDIGLETDEMATPSLFPRTVKLRYRPLSPVPKGVAPAPA